MVGHRTLRLALKRPELPLNFPHHVLHARNVLVHLLDLALAFLLALLMLEHACSFLDKRAAVLRLRLQDGIQTTLRDDRVRAGAQPRVVQNVEHVHAPRKRAVDQVFAFARAVHTPRDGNFREVDRKRAVRIVQHQVDFGNADRLACRGAGEDDVFHGLTAQVLRVALAENPQHCVRNIRLSRPIRPYYRRNARLERKRASVGKDLKPLRTSCLRYMGS